MILTQKIRLKSQANSFASLLFIGFFGLIGTGQAAERLNYIKSPFTSFSSQMTDSLTNAGRYEKPVWNLHDSLNLPKWLDISVEQRIRYETMDGNFRGGSKGGDQQIPLQTDLWLQAHLGHFRAGVEFLEPGH